MFDIGETIVHGRYGAGTVVGKKVLTIDGEKRHYICIELAGNRGTLMVQPDEIDPEEVRTTLDDLSLISEVFNNTPEELSDQHRIRQPKLNAKLRSNDPRQIAQALRDLAWRQRTANLTDTDKRIMDEALKKLLQELRISPTINSAAMKLNAIIDEAMIKHLSALGAVVS